MLVTVPHHAMHSSQTDTDMTNLMNVEIVVVCMHNPKTGSETDVMHNRFIMDYIHMERLTIVGKIPYYSKLKT